MDKELEIILKKRFISEMVPGDAPCVGNQKRQAYGKLAYALRRGSIKRADTCSLCPMHKPHAHHRDYSKPLDITWLCAEHHRQEHVRARAYEMSFLDKMFTMRQLQNLHPNYSRKRDALAFAIWEAIPNERRSKDGDIISLNAGRIIRQMRKTF